jgi:3-methylcrotonyl-CoA carboxylase alpha subunit
VDLLRGDALHRAEVTALGPGEALVEVGARRMRARRRDAGWSVEDAPPAETMVEPGRVTVFGGASGTFVFERPDPLERAGEEGGADVVVSPMPGLVRAVLVKPGHPVAKGDPLVVIEAMKMEHVLAAPRNGRVAEVMAAEGAQLEAGLPLVRLEPADG